MNISDIGSNLIPSVNWLVLIGVLIVIGFLIANSKKKKDVVDVSPLDPSPKQKPKNMLVSVAKSKQIWNNQKASFLMIDKPWITTHCYFSDKVGNTHRAQMVDACKKNGDNAIYIYFSNEGDYDSRSVNPCDVSIGHPEWGLRLNKNRIANWKEKSKILIKKGLVPIFWFYADDSPHISKVPRARLMNLAKLLIKEFDGLCAGYVIALEANEHLDQDKHNEIVKVVKANTVKNVGVHLTPMANMKSGGYLYHVDTYFLQTGFGLSVQEVGDRVAQAKKATGKRIIAAEYNLKSTSNTAREQGKEARKRGADGTGNGCK